jgi:hypothetical protein
MARIDDKYAFARGPLGEDCGRSYGEQNGLTKRELFAAMAMQELIAMTPLTRAALGDRAAVAKAACEYADALIEALK